MPFYRAMIRGENFLTDMDGSVKKWGFYAFRSVEADDPNSAELLAVQAIRDDDSLHPLVKNSTDDPPSMVVEELEELTSLDENELPKGFIWYEMNPKRRWQFWKRQPKAVP